MLPPSGVAYQVGTRQHPVNPPYHENADAIDECDDQHFGGYRIAQAQRARQHRIEALTHRIRHEALRHELPTTARMR